MSISRSLCRPCSMIESINILLFAWFSIYSSYQRRAASLREAEYGKDVSARACERQTAFVDLHTCKLFVWGTNPSPRSDGRGEQGADPSKTRLDQNA